jgi:hypothetical protein
MGQSEPAATNAPVGRLVSKTITYPSSWARFKHGSAPAPTPNALALLPLLL